MRKRAVLLGFFMLAYPLATAEAVYLQDTQMLVMDRQDRKRPTYDLEKQSGEQKEKKEEMQDASKEDLQGTSKKAACDCCQKCKSARRPVVSKEEEDKEGTKEVNGCKDCCDRCGEDQPPSPQEIPPEIIDNRIPPEIQDNRKR